MNCKMLFALLGTGFLAGCTAPVATSPTSTADYVPAFTRVAKGYRPTLPFYYPVVSYVQCEALSPEQIREIQLHFGRPLITGAYQNLIGAVVVTGAPEQSGTTFTIWLLDGRKLDSGHILPAAPTIKDIGARFYGKAIALLQQAITPQKLQEAKRVAQLVPQ